MLANLPDISFTEQGAENIETSVITTYEAIAQRTLAPGDPIRLFLEAVTAIIIQQRILIDDAAKMNLLAYSEGDYLDHIGILVGVTRLPAQTALTTVTFTLSVTQSQAVIIPSGTRVSPGNQLFFASTADVTIPSGSTTIDVPITCVTAGSTGNGYLAGQITTLVDPLPWVESVSNITASAGGIDEETDENFRDRIRQAPERYSVAGPSGAYEYWAKTTSQDIIDVSVRSPSPGQVEIRILMTGGELPTQDMLDAVLAVCNADTIRPLTDQVAVLTPEAVEYNIDLTYYIDDVNATLGTSIQQAVMQSISDYISWQSIKLGRDINPDELTTRIKNAGAKRVTIRSPVYTVIQSYQVGTLSAQTVTYGGLEDG